jgi:serine/threonine protein kinase
LIIKAYHDYQPPVNTPIVTDSITDFDALASYSANLPDVVHPKLECSLLEFAICQRPRLHANEKLWIFYQLLTVVLRLHAAELTHGDIQPPNVFIGRSLELSVTDSTPFKPARIDPYRPHFSRMRCYRSCEKVVRCVGLLRLARSPVRPGAE